MRDWMSSVETTHYILGSVVGPHPFPRIVRDFQVGDRRRDDPAVPARSSAACRTSSWPRSAAGATRRECFIRLSRCRASSWSASRRGAAPIGPATMPRPFVRRRRACCTAAISYVMQDDDGQTCDVHSISAGLDYPGVGPEHSYWKDDRPRAVYKLSRRGCARSVRQRWRARKGFCRRWKARMRCPKRCGSPPSGREDQAIVVCLSGRGDKDAAEIARIKEGSGVGVGGQGRVASDERRAIAHSLPPAPCPLPPARCSLTPDP